MKILYQSPPRNSHDRQPQTDFLDRRRSPVPHRWPASGPRWLIATESVASTTELVQVESRRAHVLATLNRADVTDALVSKGVDMDAARARIASLSDQEVLALADQLDHAPAGASGVLGTIVFIFLVLLITDILGFTKVYPFTRSIR